MENKQIEEYIERGLELELLDKLNSYVIDSFDSRCENLIKILIILQEKGKIDWMQHNQALVNVIIKVMPGILASDGDLARFTQLIKTHAASPYQNISYLNRQFIIGIEDKDDKIMNSGVSLEKLKSFQSEIKKLNVHFIKEEIKRGNDFLSIIGLLYNCVERLGEERKVFLIKEALVAFQEYISLNPKNYLSHFIRPYFTGPNKSHFDYYYHVPEPFYEQIFPNEDFPFSDFIDKANENNIEKNLIQDINEVYKRIQEIKSENDRRLVLFSCEMEQLGFQNLERFLKLQSSDHLWVRKECLPPYYKD
ncbi:MAG: hypothetical protein EOO44_06285 [Flavobacterium sp.]|nr:MAG: hypothetical protein EOO44_06285 [Flavobacterium sp.]